MLLYTRKSLLNGLFDVMHYKGFRGVMYKYFTVFVMQIRKDVSWNNIRGIRETTSPKVLLCMAMAYSPGQVLVLGNNCN